MKPAHILWLLVIGGCMIPAFANRETSEPRDYRALPDRERLPPLRTGLEDCGVPDAGLGDDAGGA